MIYEVAFASWVNNSIKFTPNSGKIIISDYIENEFTVLSIKDNGIGMSEEKAKNLFHINKQSSTKGTSGEAGSGLGLIICKEFIEKCKGEIKIKSQQGLGTEVIIRLPLLSKEQLDSVSFEIENVKTDENNISLINNSDENSNLLISSDENKKNNILIVEDEYDIRLNIKERLALYYNVFEAENGKEGIEMAIRFIPDIIVSDIMMPEIDGIELCNILKIDEKTNHIPIILLTAKDTIENKIEGLQTGADDYLTKPFNDRELLARVNTLIENRAKLIEKFKKEIFLEPQTIKISSVDEKFIKKAISIIEDNISNEKLDVELFIKEIGMSQTQLYRKIKSVTGMTVAGFIKTIRLKRATQMLKDKKKTINEIAFEIGFKDPSNFTKVFKKQFGVIPSEYYK